MLMDLNNSFKYTMGRENLSKVQFNPKLWNLRPIIRGTNDAVKIPAGDVRPGERESGHVVGGLRSAA